MIIKLCLVFPKIFLLHKVVRDAKKVEKHCPRIQCSSTSEPFGFSALFLWKHFSVRLEALRGSERRVVRIVGMVGLTLDETQCGFFCPVWLFLDMVWLFFSKDVWHPWLSKPFGLDIAGLGLTLWSHPHWGSSSFVTLFWSSKSLEFNWLLWHWFLWKYLTGFSNFKVNQIYLDMLWIIMNLGSRRLGRLLYSYFCLMQWKLFTYS